MSGWRGPEARLLAVTLQPDARAFGGVVALLLVVLGIRLALPALLARFVDDAIAGRSTGALTSVAVVYVLAALVAEVLQLGVTWASVHLSWRAGNRLRERLADHASRLDLDWHGRHSPGQLIERIDGDVEALVVFFTNVLVHVVGNAVLTVGMLAIAFSIDPRAGALLTLAAVAGTAVLFRLRVAAVPAREAEREANAILYGDLEERLGGLEDLRANGAGAYAVHRLHTNAARSWRRARRASLLGDGSYAIAAVTFATGSVLMLALGFVLQGAAVITVGQVLALFRYSEKLRQPLEVIAEQLKEFHKALAGARRAAQLLATEPTIRDGDVDATAISGGPAEVRFDGVTFAYHEDGPPALDSVDLLVPAGSHLGIVGRTGSGKTTLGRLVLRLWDTDEGAVRIGGIDVRDFTLAALRSEVAVVTQDVEIFRATLRDNLTVYGARDAGDDELAALLVRVGLEEWLAAQPSGLDTELAGTASLSAGEAQLLACARALLADPAVVVLDEASSRLDPITEARVSATMHDLLSGRTALVIAHRLSTLEEVDQIAVIDDARVVEHGDRAELAADPTSRYAALLRAAASTGDVDEVLA